MYALRCRSCDARYQRVVLQRVPDPTPEEIEVAKARLKAIHLEEMRLGIFRNFQTHRPKAG
jgi:hypothetical protein